MIVVKIYANEKFIGYKRGFYTWDYRLNIGEAQMYKESDVENIKKEMKYLFDSLEWEEYTFKYKMVKCHIIELEEIV